MLVVRTVAGERRHGPRHLVQQGADLGAVIDVLRRQRCRDDPAGFGVGIPIASFGPKTVAKLDKLLPEFARKANPVDLTGQINTVVDLVRNTCQAVAGDPRTEAVIVQLGSNGRHWLEREGETYRALARDLPVIVSFVGEIIEPDMRRGFLEAGVLTASDPGAAMIALSMVYKRRRYEQLPDVPARVPLPRRAAPRSWSETMRFCEDSGLTPARWAVLGPDDRANQACAAMTYPLVVKAMPSDSEHKTELGLVRLRVRAPEDVDALAAEFRRKLGRSNASILVQEMVGDGVEVVLSCLRKTDFGPVLSIGTGGVAIELYRDVTYLALPTTREQVLAAIQKLKLWTLLHGFRGKPPADVGALADAAVRLGDLMLAAPNISEIEINPVIVGAGGQGLRAVDTLISLEPDASGSASARREAAEGRVTS